MKPESILKIVRKAFGIKKQSPGGSEVHVPTAGSEKKIRKEADNMLDGFHDLQKLVEGTDYELAHGGEVDQETAKQVAMDNLTKDEDYYRKLMAGEDSTDDKLANPSLSEDFPTGFNLDLGSGQDREAGYLGLDIYPHDHGTIVHDLNMGIPFPDESVSKIQAKHSMHEVSDDPKPLLSEIQRVLMPQGQFVYEGPNDIYNYPDWLVMTDYECVDDQVQKDSEEPGNAYYRQVFTRIATPDPATANDAEPRIGIAQYDQLPADALIAADAVGYYNSDATSSGRGNRLFGYPSQGALVSKIKAQDCGVDNTSAVSKADLTTQGRKHIKDSNFALPEQRKYPINDIAHARNALSRVAQFGTDEEKSKVRAAVHAKYPELAKKTASRIKKAVPIIKADKPKQIVCGVVLSPDEADSQGDVMSAEDIEEAAHFYMAESRVVGKEHSSPVDAVPVESYIAPQDFEWPDMGYGPQTVKKGAWVLAVRIEDKKQWAKIEDGEYQAFSVGGFGLRD